MTIKFLQKYKIVYIKHFKKIKNREMYTFFHQPSSIALVNVLMRDGI